MAADPPSVLTVSPYDSKPAKPLEVAAYDIFCAAKAGNLEAVKYFIEERGVDVNCRYHDATPLYYTCLCGHYEVAQYLLNQGAYCAENTYDGDRCLYGALTDDIRHLLKNYSTRPTPITPYAQQFGEMLKALTVEKESKDSTYCSQSFDVVFHVTDHSKQQRPNDPVEIRAHSFVLCARRGVHALGNMLRQRLVNTATSQSSRSIHFQIDDVCPEAFLVLIKYCYMDVVDLRKDTLQGFLALCEKYRLVELQAAVLEHVARSEQQSSKIKNKAIDLISKAFEEKSPREKKQRYLSVQPLDEYSLTKDLKEAFCSLNDYAFCSDLQFLIEGILIPCHTCVLASRSVYFRALIEFEMAKRSTEAMDSKYSTVAQVLISDISYKLFAVVLEYLYSNDLSNLGAVFDPSSEKNENSEAFVKLLEVASRYMLPDLASKLCAYMEQEAIVCATDVFFWLEVAELYNADGVRQISLDCLGEYLIHLPLDFEAIHSVEKGSYDLQTLALPWFDAEQKYGVVRSLKNYLINIKDRKDPRQNRPWFHGKNAETAATFLIAEVREAMIENMKAATESWLASA